MSERYRSWVHRLAAAGLAAGCLLWAGPGVGEVLTGHQGRISYDTEARAYSLEGIEGTIPAAEVERSLPLVLCGQCHEEAVAQLKASVHFRVQAPNPRLLFPGGGAHGALDRACGLPGSSALINYVSDVNLSECGKCHVGRFIPPMESAFTSSFAQLFQGQLGLAPADAMAQAASNARVLVDGGLDCLICHAEVYRSVRPDVDWADPALAGTHRVANYAAPGAPSPSPEGYAKNAHDSTDFDHDGEPDPLIQVDTDGDGEPDLSMPLMVDSNGDGTRDRPWTTVSQDRSPEAVLSVGSTDAHACLRCHEHARTGYKRGTLFRPGYDVHATACFDDGAGGCIENTCIACHRTFRDGDLDGDGLKDVHKFVRGHLVGGDLAAADYTPPPPGVEPDPSDPTHLTCVQCHDPARLPHRGGGVHSPRHLERIACQTCHITASGGITYSLYGHGAHFSFGRNAQGRDTKLITLDHMRADEDEPGDVDSDFAAYRLSPVLMWFDGQTSFLAQSLAIRSSPNARIVPFKPMANGMVMDGRFFRGDLLTNQAGFPYNAHSMYRFFAGSEDCDNLDLPGKEPTDPFTCGSDGRYGNAEVFEALGLIGSVRNNQGELVVQGMTPEEVRTTTLMDLMPPPPGTEPRLDKQGMAMMQAFPNLMNFGKAAYAFEHYLVSSELAGGPVDGDGDGIVDADAAPLFDMLTGVNAGLAQFKGFNQPMFLPPGYDWYPPFDGVSDVATMKLPDGSFMKLFLTMGLQSQLAGMGYPEDQIAAIIEQQVGSYPAYSNGVTLGGHGVAPNPARNALGAGGCSDCHGADGALARPVPVTRTVLVDVPGMGQAGMPVWQWVYYNVKNLIALGVRTENADLLDPATGADVDLADEPADSPLVRRARLPMVLNWFDPGGLLTRAGEPISGYRPFTPADNLWSRFGTRLLAEDLTWYGGDWMPVLEPVTDPVPNYAVLGYARDEVIFSAGGGGGGGGGGCGGGGCGRTSVTLSDRGASR